ncbi:hypothetical protein VE02_03931 [Pseudogymnoascus sp. 03VT05]|nr:hypothetical protein VE02_03931 [Pseudogymnoascus sp. 03VT05]
MSRDPELARPEDLDSDPTSLSKRDLRSCAAGGVVTGGSIAVLTVEAGPLGLLAGLAGGGIATAWCLISESEASVKKLVGYSGPTTRGKAAQIAAIAAGQLIIPALIPNPKAGPKNPTGAGIKMYGRYAQVDFGQQTFCSVTYSCEYGFGFDQVCDNQRWGIDEITMSNIFHYDEGGSGNGRTKGQWRSTTSRNPDWYNSFTVRLNNANGRRLRCEILLPSFSAHSLIQFDSSSGLDQCYATYTDTANAAESPVPDHGFRVQTDDPLFLNYGWPKQNYSPDPATQNPRPTSVNSANWKRDIMYQTTVEVPARRTPRNSGPTQTATLDRNASEAQDGGRLPHDESLVTAVGLSQPLVSEGAKA